MTQNGPGGSLADPVGIMVHPVRLRILAEFAGRTLTTGDLVIALSDIPQATLYRHVAMLRDAGILEVVSETASRGAVERTLRVAAGRARLEPEDLAGYPAAEHARLFSIFAAALVDTMADALSRAEPDELMASGLSYQRAVIHLDRDELNEARRRMAEVVDDLIARPPAPHRTAYTLGSVVIPRPEGTTP